MYILNVAIVIKNARKNLGKCIFENYYKAIDFTKKDFC